ncbi:MAG TPA: hypothetical protein VFV60_05755 [bacterium]|nr:hypothetical protein [bacterium]
MSARFRLLLPSQANRAKQSAYAKIGLGLLLGGVLAAPIFFFVANSVPLTALALSAVLLGTIAFFLDRSLPQVPPRAAQLLLESGLANLSGLLEETGVSAPAVYLPSILTEGQPRALISLSSHGQRPTISQINSQRLIVEFGPHPDDIGLLVSTPGGGALSLLDEHIGSTSAELESALTKLLVGAFDIASNVQVNQENGLVTVQVGGIRLTSGNLWVYKILGTPVASVAAAVVAEARKAPVVVESEARTKDVVTVRLAVTG